MGEFMDVYMRSSKSFRAATETALRRHGLYLGQNLVLAALWERDGQTPGAIAKAVNITTPTIAKMAGRMTTAGLLTRRRDDRDNRLVRLHLTDAGHALREAVEKEMDSLEHELTAGLSKTEIATLIDLMSRVGANARALGEEAAADEA